MTALENHKDDGSLTFLVKCKKNPDKCAVVRFFLRGFRIFQSQIAIGNND